MDDHDAEQVVDQPQLLRSVRLGVCGGPHVANETSDVRSVSLPVGLADTRGQTAMV